MQAVSDLRHSGNDYQVATTQPLSENAPAFFQLKDSPAAAAFIAGFKSQKDNDNFRFLRVAANKVGEVVQALHNLTNNPKDEEGLKALREHTVTSYQLDKVKFATPDLHLQELQQMGIIVSPQELEAMKLGLSTQEIHDLNFKLGNMSVVGQFALSPYRDQNNEVQIGLQSVLARPEYEREEYKMVFSTSDKETLAAGRTLDRLVELPNPHTGEKEWCHVGLNRATNRFVTVPHREVNDISYFNGVRLTDAQKEIAMTGGRFRVEGCQARNIPDLTYAGTVQFDVHAREYRMTDYAYSRPYIPQVPAGWTARKRKNARFSARTASPTPAYCASTRSPTVWSTTSPTSGVRSRNSGRATGRHRTTSRSRAAVANANQPGNGTTR